jgi:hypothetical protein
LLFLLFENPEQFLALSWFYIQEWGHTLLSLLSCILYSIWCYQKLCAVWVFKEFQADFAPSFSEEAPIQCMPRIWHLPCQVGGMCGCSFFMEH